jgi:hypothetical protein
MNRYQHLQTQIAESAYKTSKSASLGRIARGNLPSNIDPYTTTFGMKTVKSESAKESISPSKPRHQVELETSDKHSIYVLSHKSYEPGEQVERSFTNSFDREKRFGAQTEAHNDGRHVKEALVHLPLRNMERRTLFDTKAMDDFREKHTSQVGQKLDPKKDTRFLGEDHTFGLLNQGDNANSGDVLHNRSESRFLKGKEKERAHIATVRTHLARFNYTKFKTVVDAFKFYDKVSLLISLSRSLGKIA